jgi:hypothetical protein
MTPEFAVRQNSLKSVHRSIHKFNRRPQRQQRPRQSRKRRNEMAITYTQAQVDAAAPQEKSQ